MSVEQLLAAFSSVGDDSGRIQQFRKLAVALAISGKLNSTATILSPQRLGDTLDRVKAALAKCTKVAKAQLPPEFSDPTRFALLGELAAIEKGRTGIRQAMPGPYPLVVTGAERSSCDHFDFEGAACIVPLVSSAGHGKASLHRLHYQDGRFAVGTILAAVFPHDPNLISPRFLFEYLSAFKNELLVSRMTGTANVTLTIGRIANVPVPLICPNIQRKVDELMALCDQLEAARAEREATRDRLTAVSLARLNTPDPKTFLNDARFALDALPALTTRPDQIKQLRQTILNLAVRGKLVPQDPNDEPVPAVLKSRRTIVSGIEPFKLPLSWAWINVGAVAETRLGKMLDKAKNKGTPKRYLRNINVRWFDFDLSDLLEMRFEDSEFSEFALRAGDVLICEGGEPGRAAVWDERDSDIYFQKAIHRVRFSNIVDSQYFVKALRASADDERLSEYFTGTGIKHFTGKSLNAYLIPLPPPAEQRRIVAKVNELMALCDQLEAQLATSDTESRRLLDAVLHEVLSPKPKAAVRNTIENATTNTEASEAA